MTLMITREGVEYECWGRTFIILKDGTVKRFSWSRLSRILGASWCNGDLIERDLFNGAEVRKSSGRLWVRTARLVVRTHLPDPIAYKEFIEYEVNERGLVLRNTREWKPSTAQMRAMRKATFIRKVHRP